MKPVNFTPLSCSSDERRFVDPGQARGGDALRLLVLLRLQLGHDLGVADEDLGDLAARTCCSSSLIGTVFGAVRFATTPWMKRSAAKARR